ncbi:MAG: TolC family protein [Proteobacteria bacterium]|nr:TolC family protein [Pseudomonadota bacterium]
MNAARGALWVLAVAASPGFAATPVAGPVSIAQLVAQAVHAHPDVQAARAAVAVAQARLAQAGLRPAPELEVSVRSDWLFGNEGEYSRSIGIAQSFAIGGRRAREKDVARADVAIASTQVAQVQWRLAGEVIATAEQWLLLERKIALQDARERDEKALARVAQARFKAAEVSQLDIDAVRLDLLAIKQQREHLQGQRDAARIALAALLAQPQDTTPMPADALPTPGELSPLPQWQQRALAQRPELLGAAWESERADASRALAVATRWPDWTLRLELAQDRLALQGAPAQRASRALGVSLSVPLPLTARTDAEVAQADAERVQAQAKARGLRLVIAAEVAAAYAQADRARLIWQDNQRQLRPLAQRSLQLAEQGYRQGLLALTEVTQARKRLADIDDTGLDALGDYAQALARLRAASGELPLPNDVAGAAVALPTEGNLP